MKPKTRAMRTALIIRDPRQPKLDFTMPKAQAEKLLAKGRLVWNLALAQYQTRSVWDDAQALMREAV